MKNVLQIISFHRFFRVKKFQEFLHKLGCYVDLERANLDGLINHKLKEELIDSLEVWPGWIHLFFLINTGLRESKVGLLDVGERPKDVLLDHLHDFIEVGDDNANDVFLVLKHLLELLNGVKSFSL